jgi:anaerobic ribonucleoside-triphosphate reductase activating protein
MKNNTIRIAGKIDESIVDGPGLRLVIFTQGCNHNCPGCHNPETHPFDGGYDFNIQTIGLMIKDNPLLTGITISGGDPFFQFPEFRNLLQEIHSVKSKSFMKGRKLDIWVYTGFIFEDLCQMDDNAMKLMYNYIDVLVDGPYIESLKDRSLQYRGSSNQRMIDVKKSIDAKNIILWNK